MYFLGIDLGSSSVKLALVEAASGSCIGVVQEPKEEASIYAAEKGWAEQNPLDWWKYVCDGIKNIKSTYGISKEAIVGIGIAYQMHGLVVVDKEGNCLRKSIIWCDSRAVGIGNAAYNAIGNATCDAHLLNSPANFTAAKLQWVQEHEPAIYSKIAKFMLPGDYLAYRFSQRINTTISGLSEGVFWDFKKDEISEHIKKKFRFSEGLYPDVVPTFSKQSVVSLTGAEESGLAAGTPILYRAGDQPNNALSLNVLQAGEVAATGGTSGVVYAVTKELSVKESARVNNFAHVNYQQGDKNIGKLLCINGAGILYRWLLNTIAMSSYEEMNELASSIPVGADGICILPFGNGAERMLQNQDLGMRMLHLNFNRHTKAHICRAALEGIAFSFVYGMEIMHRDGIHVNAIKAGNDNLFRSEVFATTIATLIEKEIEIYNTTGAIGAARACAIYTEGYDVFSSFLKNDHVLNYSPLTNKKPYKTAYGKWKNELESILNK